MQVHLGGEIEQWMVSVTVGGPGLVAVGWDGPSEAVWTSPDGISWSRVPDDDAVFSGAGNQEMSGVTVGAPGLVAVGSDQSGGDADVAVWTSPDGIPDGISSAPAVSRVVVSFGACGRIFPSRQWAR